MAFTRKFLAALGIEPDKIDEIISAHIEVTDALKEQRDAFKSDAEKLAEVQKKLDEAEAANGEGWKTKYDALNKQFEDYKTEVSSKETRAAKVDAYRQILVSAGINGKLVDTILASVDMDKIEMADGKITTADAIAESVKTEWKDYIGTVSERGENPAQPPQNNNIDYDAMSDDEYYRAMQKGK